VCAARAPVAGSFFTRNWRPSLRLTFRFRRVPDPPAREPLHHYIGIRPAKLRERRQQLLLLARAERCRLAVDEDGPVSIARGHECDLTGIRDLTVMLRLLRRIRGCAEACANGFWVPLAGEALELFDEGRALEVEKSCGLAFVPASALERQLNELALDTPYVRVQVETVLWQRQGG